MKLLQITDIHLTALGKTIGGRDPNANFAKALNHAITHHPDAEALIITGDLSDWGDAADYERLKAYLGEVALPVHLCIGNHDDRQTFLQVFPETEGSDGFVQSVIPLSLGHGILLDTWGQDTHAGQFCEKRAAWLEQTLDTLEGPVWIFMHHNPVPIEIAPMDEIMLLDADRFAATVAPHAGKIRHIFHGHCHMHLSGSLHGIPFSAPRGTNHAGWPDFAATKLLSGADLTESYSVIFASETTTMVHMVEYGYAGEIRGEGSPDYADWDQLTMVR
ncbi:phosphodiesterase [Pacificibacter marinus]|uniref:3',5'-cyclic adenosine monophosphate phosphodiesterase CpdA n=1 Tax=Pacificibacter marinus TaxID=658057 RepID=A0A1Y5RDB9_9RHOB|nr:phosphodiesterase [Pacificibacter marinus]SEK23356.1 3',5'-cyclic AMP phosphodiesterase CpdA [Pacificibacter marinus]SLN14492.1 3',5'-cyclic adenosine monophosphate phosphodiesterase CpdA [Pacificibacter marinus]